MCQAPRFSLSGSGTAPPSELATPINVLLRVRIARAMAVIDIRIELKRGVADPEGTNTRKTLESLGFKGIESVKSVKVFEIELDMSDEEALKAGDEYCRRLLANPVVQSYRVSLR